MASAENPVKQLEHFGQAVWLDYIRRHLLTSAEFRRILDEDGLKGMTSNPTIFEKAIAGSTDYDDQLKELAPTKRSIDEIYEALSMQDIRMAADAFRPLYDKTGGIHGYISYEVSPTLANDTDGTIAAARRYWDTLARPNVMIKVPSTPAGLPAIEQLISEGRNVNVTLMFSIKHYDDVAEAFIRGLERRLRAGKSINKVWLVASVFVSRVETLVDRKLEDKLKGAPNEAVAALMGQSAVANSRLIYQRYKEIFAGARFKDMLAKGGRPQWPLWASTGTKNHAYSDVKYVEELVDPDTVNTMPPATMDAFRDHGKPRASLAEDVAEARDVVKRLAAAGIDLIEVGEELQKEGVESFAQSFEDLSAVIKGRRAAIIDGAHDKQTIAAIGYESQVSTTFKDLDKNDFPARLWKKDATLWSKEPKEQEAIKNGLGFLTVPETMAERVKELASFAHEVRSAGIRDVVLLGMGGSSQSAELFATTFSSAPGYPKLHVLDTTVPETIRALDRNIDCTRSLFVVASKTGDTIETESHFNTFFEHVKAKSSNPAGSHFVAVTDPGTKLAALAKENKFRRVFLNRPEIVGCYAVLSYFGLVPAALIGMDVATLVDRGIRMTHSSAGCVRVEENLGVSLGAALGALKKAGRDKATFIISPAVSAFGLWVEQLIAESTGKRSRYRSCLRRADGPREVLRQGPRLRLPQAQKRRRFRAGRSVRGDQKGRDTDRAYHAVGQNRSGRRIHALGDRIGDSRRGDGGRAVQAAGRTGEQGQHQPHPCGVRARQEVSRAGPRSGGGQARAVFRRRCERRIERRQRFSRDARRVHESCAARRLLRCDGVRFAQSDGGEGDRRDSQSRRRALRHCDNIRLRSAMPAFYRTVAQGRSEHRLVPANHAGPSRLDYDSR